MHSHTDRRGQARWDRPQGALQENEVDEFHWTKLRRNGGFKARGGKESQQWAFSGVRRRHSRGGEAGCSSEAETDRVRHQEGISRTQKVNERACKALAFRPERENKPSAREVHLISFFFFFPPCGFNFNFYLGRY